MFREKILQARLGRIKQAVALKTPDRVPVILEYAAFAARITHTPMREFLLDPGKSIETMIEAYKLVTEKADADGVNYGAFSPYGLSYLWLSKVRVPGIDLPPDASYQVVEEVMMKREDYDMILDRGWPDFFNSFMKEKILDKESRERLSSYPRGAAVRKEWAEYGVPVLCGGTVAPPFEQLCGGRSLTEFFMDLLDIPDKVEAVMNEMMSHMRDRECQRALSEGYPAVWIGGWRGNPATISPRMWDRFFWHYFRKLVVNVVEHDLIPILHLDGNWDRELSRFKELPRGKVIMALDGYTDIYLAKKVLGEHLCIMGDVPATMLAFQDPDTVYRYSAKLVRDLGPDGFILHSGCDIPENATLENVRAMVAAAYGR